MAKRKKKRSRRGKMPAGLRAYWAKKRRKKTGGGVKRKKRSGGVRRRKASKKSGGRHSILAMLSPAARRALRC